MRSVPDYFGCLVFNDKVMKANLPTEVYESLKKTREEGVRLASGEQNSNINESEDDGLEPIVSHGFSPLPAG